MKTAFFLARKFIFNIQERTIRLMLIICFMSIMIGAFALALVAAVMNGFEKETQKAVQGIQPDLIINAGGQSLAYEKIQNVLSQYPFIKATSPSSQGYALIKSFESDEIVSLVMLMAIDPAKQMQISQLHNMIKSYETSMRPPKTNSGSKPNANSTFSGTLEGNQVLIGQTLALQLGAKVHDTITLLFTNDSDTASIMLEKKEVKIGGIFKTGIEDIDSHLIFADFSLFNSLYPEKGITQIGVKLSNPSHEKEALETLKVRFPSLNIFSWKELYPALLSALVLEKYAMFFILALITLVASMNIVALLFMYITTKKTEIAVLKTLGLGHRESALIFMLIGVGISFVATILGLVAATGASYLLKHYPIIPLPEVYYVSHLPAEMDASIIVAVLLVVLIVSFIASAIPARAVYKLDAAPVLKHMV